MIPRRGRYRRERKASKREREILKMRLFRWTRHPAIEAELIALYLIKPRIISLTRADPLFFLPTASHLLQFSCLLPPATLSLSRVPSSGKNRVRRFQRKELSPHTTFLDSFCRKNTFVFPSSRGGGNPFVKTFFISFVDRFGSTLVSIISSKELSERCTLPLFRICDDQNDFFPFFDAICRPESHPRVAL